MAWFMNVWEEQPYFKWEEWKDGRPDLLPFGGLTPGPKITDPSALPKTAVQKDTKKLCDVINVQDQGLTLIIVSARFKAIIEHFEPEKHQFFPVTLKRKSGAVYDDKYFIFHPTSNAPCVLVSKCDIQTTIVVKYGPRTGMPSKHIHYDGYVISRPAYGTRKVFGSPYVGNDSLLVTDDVMDRMKAERITNLYARPAKELDEPFVFENEDPELAAWLASHPTLRTEWNFETF
jgi:hypothetical protein